MATAPVSAELRDPVRISGSRETPALSAGRGGGARRRLVRPRVLLTTEGTYPYVMGGVSSWCDLLVKSLTGFDWQVLPIVAPRRAAADVRAARPRAARSGGSRSGQRSSPKRRDGRGGDRRRAARRCPRSSCATCRRGRATPRRWWRRGSGAGASRPACAGPSAPTRGWASFLAGLREVLAERVPEAGTPPALDLVEAATLYQTLYWVARTAAAPTPDDRRAARDRRRVVGDPRRRPQGLHRTPMVLTEHGVYVREAYLAAARNGESPGSRFAATRLARGLARDRLCGRRRGLAGHRRQRLVGDGARHRPRRRSSCSTTGCSRRPSRRPPPRDARPSCRSAASIRSRTSHTMLRVAAQTLRFVPERPLPALRPGAARRGDLRALVRGAARTARARRALPLHGPDGRSHGVVRAADVVLMTSISEGLPMSILEAMGQARPVVSTGVGGVPEVVRGCGDGVRARRRPRAGDGGRHAAAQPRAGLAARAGAGTAGSGASSTSRPASTATASCSATLTGKAHTDTGSAGVRV